MLPEDSRVLEFNTKNKTPSIIYADSESLTKRIDGCQNNFEKLFTTKVGQHISSGYSISIIWTFQGVENKHDVYRGEDCMKKFCESSRDSSTKINNFQK